MCFDDLYIEMMNVLSLTHHLVTSLYKFKEATEMKEVASTNETTHKRKLSVLTLEKKLDH